MPTIDDLRTAYTDKITTALEPEFEERLFNAALNNLGVPGPLCINNFSYALRELIAHLLKRLASNENVTACTWFKPHPTVTGGITRAHLATYAIQGGLSTEYVSKVLNINVSPVVDDLMRSITTLNKHTHVTLETFDYPHNKVLELAEECLQAVLYFVEHMAACRDSIVEALESDIDGHLLEAVISETIQEIDELATHHWIDEVDILEINIREIGPKSITLEVEGEISVNLQYGSDSDVRNDIGTVIDSSFPLKAKLNVPMTRPLGKSATVASFKVDTHSWYE